MSDALVDEEQRQIYLSRAQEVEPNIQYCAYQIGQQQGMTDVKKLMELRNKAATMAGTQEFLAAEIDVSSRRCGGSLYVELKYPAST